MTTFETTKYDNDGEEQKKIKAEEIKKENDNTSFAPSFSKEVQASTSVPSLSGMFQSLSQNPDVENDINRSQAYVSHERNINPNITDEEILRKLGVPPEKIFTITPEELIPLIKRERIRTYLTNAEKAKEDTPTYQFLQQQLANKNLTAYQKSLYFKADVVAAFDKFMHNTYIKQNFIDFAKTLNTSQSPEQLMVEFLTSEMYEDTLIHMLNKQYTDPNTINTNYIKENMFYRAQVWQTLKKIDTNTILTDTAKEQEKKDINATTDFLRAKTNIIAKHQDETNEQITDRIKALLLTPLPHNPEKRYIDILAQSHIIEFIENSVIAAIRTEETADGKIVFNEKTQVHTITDLQFYYYLATSFKEKKEQPLKLNLQMSADDKEILDALQALGIGKEAIEGKKNSNNQKQKTLKESHDELQKATKSRRLHQREQASKRKEKKEKSALGTSTPSSKEGNDALANKSIANLKGKEIVSNNPSITSYIAQSLQGIQVPADRLAKRNKEIQEKAFHRYIESKDIGLHYEEIQSYFEDGQIINREGLENFLREKKQLSPEHIQELVQKIQQFTPNQYPKMISEYLEWKTKVFMAQQRELQLVSFGWIFDRIKEGMNITVSSQQNFAQDFVFQSIDNIEIQSGKLIIKGDTKGVPTNFYYDLITGNLSMNGTIGEEKNAFFLYKDNIRNHIAHFPPFDTIIDRGKQAIMDNLHQFKKGETGEVNKQTANNILESNKIDPPAVLKTNVENQMSKNQILEYCIQNFGLNFTKTSISATEDPELYHLFSLLNRSINSNNSLKSKKCLEMLVELTNIHQKLQQLGNHQHPPSIDIYINNSSVDNTTTKHSDPTLDLIFSEDHCKDSISRGKALNTYLSAYSKGIGNEEKIDITKLYEDLQCITEKKPYKQPDKLVLASEPGRTEEEQKANDDLEYELQKAFSPSFA